MSPRWWKAFAMLGWTLLFFELVLRVGPNGLVLPGTLAVCCLIVLVGMAVLADEPPARRKALSHARTDPGHRLPPGAPRRTRA